MSGMAKGGRSVEVNYWLDPDPDAAQENKKTGG